jgi:hypothetical protein
VVHKDPVHALADVVEVAHLRAHDLHSLLRRGKQGVGGGVEEVWSGGAAQEIACGREGGSWCWHWPQ